jgi:protein TonB
VVGAPPGPGVPTGLGTSGDWYIASVVGRISAIWQSQLRTEHRSQVLVGFTILKDGSVKDIELVQSSGSSLLDKAALRAIHTAAPFGSLPKHYETNAFAIRILFTPPS